MSFFGASATTGGGLFGSSTQPQNQQNTQPQGSSLFGGLLDQPKPAQSASPFGQSTQQTQQSSGGLFGNKSQSGGVFGQSQAQQPQQWGLFGQNQAQQSQPQQAGLFAQSQTQQTQQPQQGFGFGQSKQLGQSTQRLAQQPMYTPAETPDTSVVGQIQRIKNQWDTGSPDCVFRHYFYNKVDENKAPFYRPSPREDDNSWQDALAAKPGPGYIPVLCIGFSEMGDRIKTQQRNLATFNQRLHDINNSLEAMLTKHDTNISVRALDARRRHTVLKYRAMKLSTTVQILRNRGYALSVDEEELKSKLLELERSVLDPGLGARGEEIWARMVNVRERTRILKEEMNRRANTNGSGLDEETARRAERILEDFGKQLGHLKRELVLATEELKEWEKDQPAQTGAR